MENEFEDFEIDLNEGGGEQEGYILKPVSPEEGYVKEVYLLSKPQIKQTKDNTGIYIQLDFGTKDGGKFSHNILNPIYRNGATKEDNDKLTGSNMSKLKHIFSSLTPSKYVTKTENGKKVKAKPELSDMKFKSLKDLFEHLVKIVPDDATMIPMTLKLVSKNGRTEFPTFPPFIANVWNEKDATKDFQWNPQYDHLTSLKAGGSSNPKPDVESGDEPNYA